MRLWCEQLVWASLNSFPQPLHGNFLCCWQVSFSHSLHGSMSSDFLTCVTMWFSRLCKFSKVLQQTPQEWIFMDVSQTSSVLSALIPGSTTRSSSSGAMFLVKVCFSLLTASIMGRGSSLATCFTSDPCWLATSGSAGSTFLIGLRRKCTSNSSGAIGEGSGERHFERYFERWQSERPAKERPAPGPAPYEEITNWMKISSGDFCIIILEPNLLRYPEWGWPARERLQTG